MNFVAKTYLWLSVKLEVVVLGRFFSIRWSSLIFSHFESTLNLGLQSPIFPFHWTTWTAIGFTISLPICQAVFFKFLFSSSLWGDIYCTKDQVAKLLICCVRQFFEIKQVTFVLKLTLYIKYSFLFLFLNTGSDIEKSILC